MKLVKEINKIIRRSYPKETLVVDAPMIWGFIGIWLHMGLNVRPRIRDYWEKPGDPWVKGFGGHFRSRHCWNLIFRSLFHLSDSFLSWMEQELNETFVRIWRCGQAVSIDEIMKRFKGRSRHKVYEPSKPARRGLKWFVLFFFELTRGGMALSIISGLSTVFRCTDTKSK